MTHRICSANGPTGMVTPGASVIVLPRYISTKSPYFLTIQSSAEILTLIMLVCCQIKKWKSVRPLGIEVSFIDMEWLHVSRGKTKVVKVGWEHVRGNCASASFQGGHLRRLGKCGLLANVSVVVIRKLHTWCIYVV